MFCIHAWVEVAVIDFFSLLDIMVFILHFLVKVGDNYDKVPPVSLKLKSDMSEHTDRKEADGHK